MSRAPVALFLLLAALAGAAVPAVGQSRATILEEPDGTAVGLAIVLSAGGGWEPASEAGVTHLAALAVVEEVRHRLAGLGGFAEVRCDRTSIGFTLVLPPESWREGVDVFANALFRGEPGGEAVAAAQRDLLGMLRAGEGSPAGEAKTTVYEALFGEAHHWARPPCGRTETVASLDHASVARLVRTRFLPSRATAALAGPVDREQARAILEEVLGETRLPVLLPPPPPEVAHRRQALPRNTVTAWIALAYPIGAEVRPAALGLLAARIREATAPGAARPGVYDLDIRLERHGTGGAWIVHLITAPEQAEQWERTVRDVVRETAETPMRAERIDALLRRFRGERLLELAAPEARAWDAAVQLFFEGRYEPAPIGVDSLTAESLQSAAAALGDPAIAVLGPR